MTDLISIFGVGAAGWVLARLARMPAPAIIGSMLAVGLAKASGFDFAPLPAYYRQVVQIGIGTVVGLRFTAGTFWQLKLMLGPALLVATWMVFTGLGAGYALLAVTNLDPATALFGSVPGGIAEMSGIAIFFGADGAKVALLQLSRILVVSFVLPLVGERVARPECSGSEVVLKDLVAAAENDAPRPKAGPLPDDFSCRTVPGDEPAFCIKTVLPKALTVTAGAIGGIIVSLLGVPAGGMVGAMLTVGSLKAAGVSLETPFPCFQEAAQLGIGCLIGMSFSPETLLAMTGVALPVAVLTTIMLGSGLLLARVLRLLTGWDPATCLFGTAPAGFTLMVLLSEFYGGSSSRVAMLHLVRLTSMILIMPVVFGYLVK